MDRKRKLEGSNSGVAEPGKLARNDDSPGPAQEQAADSMRKRKVEAQGPSPAMSSPSSASVVKRARFADDVGARSAAGSQPPSASVVAGASEAAPEDFVTTLAKQLEKIALYGNAFFTQLAFGQHAAPSSTSAAAARTSAEAVGQEQEQGRSSFSPPDRGGSPALRAEEDYYDSLQAARCQLFALVEEMLLRAHEIEELPFDAERLRQGATAQEKEEEEEEEVVPAPGAVPVPAPAVRDVGGSNWLALGLAESNAELSRRMKEVADTSGLLDDVIRHLYNE